MKNHVQFLLIDFRGGSSAPSLSGSSTPAPFTEKDSHEFLETIHGPIIGNDETETLFTEFVESTTVLTPQEKNENNDLEITEFLNLYQNN